MEYNEHPEVLPTSTILVQDEVTKSKSQPKPDPDPLFPVFSDWGPVMDSDTVKIPFPNSLDWVVVLRYVTEAIDSTARDAASEDGRVSTSTSTAGTRAQRRAAGGRGKAPAQEETKMEMVFKQVAYTSTLLSLMIREWSFKTSSGQSIPITLESISRLPNHTSQFLMNEINRMNPKYDEPLPAEEDVEPEFDAAGARTGPLGVVTAPSSRR